MSRHHSNPIGNNSGCARMAEPVSITGSLTLIGMVVLRSMTAGADGTGCTAPRADGGVPREVPGCGGK
jgi:hypothetical protein